MTTFIIGCTHFDDETILQWRRFSSVDEMNSLLEENWRRAVSKDDHVYVLGDFALRRPAYWQNRLPGKKILILGNHDPFMARDAGFSEVKESALLRLKDGRNMVACFLSHYPHLSWPERGEGSVHLHAHCHGSSPGSLPGTSGPPRLDMSAEIWQYTPVSVLDAIRAARRRAGN